MTKYSSKQDSYVRKEMSTTFETVIRNSTYIEHKLMHYQQRSNWDCGIASVMMILSPEQRQNLQNNFSEICQDEGFAQSTWTIDLCYLLLRYGIEHCMYTTIKGVGKTQASNKIEYQERKRVEERFANAEQAGILIKVQQLTSEQLLKHVASKGPAIVLVDAALLVCDWCKHNKLRAEFRCLFGGPYRGHYVVVVGRTGDKILYRNPIFHSKICSTSLASFHSARRVSGTDFDVIVIFKDYR